jgi:hypothetical protein
MITVTHVAMVVPEGVNSDAAIEGVRAKGIGFLSLDLGTVRVTSWPFPLF